MAKIEEALLVKPVLKEVAFSGTFYKYSIYSVQIYSRFILQINSHDLLAEIFIRISES